MKYVMHIPTQCCYTLEPDGETVVISGARLKIRVDGEIFWKYVDAPIEKKVVATDPFAAGKDK